MTSDLRARAAVTLIASLLFVTGRDGTPFTLIAQARATNAPVLQQRGESTQKLAKGSSRTSAPLRLLRCYFTRELGCFQIVGNIAPGAADEPKMWPATLDSANLIGPGPLRSDFGQGQLHLLIVYDVSGSMIGEGMSFTRSALRQFLDSLPPNVLTALVPFESRGVAAAFSNGHFARAEQARAQLLELRIRLPLSDANTALYSAIAQGLAMLNSATPAGGRSIMLVVTDGKNDVGHPHDDRGLLGEEGRAGVRDLIAGTAHDVWLVGAGTGVDSTVLNELAGSTGHARTAAMDPAALGKLLRKIREEMTPTRMAVYAIPAGVQGNLGRRLRHFQVAAVKEAPFMWRPPLFALPPFEASADSTLLLLPRVRDMADGVGGTLMQRLLIGTPLLLLLLLAYWALPQFFSASAAPGASPANAAEVGESKPIAKVPAKTETSRLREMAEAPPRKPSDVTKDAALR